MNSAHFLYTVGLAKQFTVQQKSNVTDQQHNRKQKDGQDAGHFVLIQLPQLRQVIDDDLAGQLGFTVHAHSKRKGD